MVKDYSRKMRATFHYVDIFMSSDEMSINETSITDKLTNLIKIYFPDIVERADHGDLLENLSVSRRSSIFDNDGMFTRSNGLYMISTINGFKIVDISTLDLEEPSIPITYPNPIFKSIIDFPELDYWIITNNFCNNPISRVSWNINMASGCNYKMVAIPQNLRDFVENARIEIIEKEIIIRDIYYYGDYEYGLKIKNNLYTGKSHIAHFFKDETPDINDLIGDNYAALSDINNMNNDDEISYDNVDIKIDKNKNNHVINVKTKIAKLFFEYKGYTYNFGYSHYEPDIRHLKYGNNINDKKSQLTKYLTRWKINLLFIQVNILDYYMRTNNYLKKLYKN